MHEERVAIYTRVSTLDQSDGGQEKELRELAQRKGWSVFGIYQDKVSGLKKTRPELDRLLADAKRGHFSYVLVWRIDRLGRSVSHLLEVLETLKVLGIKFVSLNEAIDTSTPAGMLIFTVLGSVAAFERSILVERVRMGIQHAKRRGVKLGRPALTNLSENDIASMRQQRATGVTFRELAKEYGTSVWTVHKLCSMPGGRVTAEQKSKMSEAIK
jgi:DNA invertase Pin-like site-specific DNA recombinase